MWGSRLKSFTVVILLLAMTGLTMAWFFLNHIAFATIGAVMLLGVPVALSLRDSWRQTSPASLAARGITPESVRRFNEADPGLRREMSSMIPAAVHRRITRNRTLVVASAAGPGTPLTSRTPPVASRTRPVPSGIRPAREADPAGRRRQRRGTQMLPPDATITLADERRAAGIDDLLASLDSALIGLVPVKKKVEEIGSLLLVDRARQRFGLSASRPNLHMCFTGAPGTGKTTVALLMARLLHQLGYLEKGHLVHAMRDDLVGEYIGHTAPKTKQVLDRAMGGVLFIDEAYSLYRADDSKDYGQECIDILLQVMENDRDKLVVILAGYKDRMEYFFQSNPGMSSRIAHHLDFAEYEVDELLAIGQLMLDQSSYYLSQEATAAFRDYLSERASQPRFANARSVRNELERARLRHAYRLAGEPDRNRTKDDLMRLDSADFPPSPGL
jgi:probable Rubsico expression protein CbbX